MDNAEFISVIIPVYNAETYLSRCIGSLCMQDYPNYEIILVDDGSSDQSGKMCKDYSLRDNRIRTIYQKNAGVSSARNTGIHNAKGDYITFVDADDWVSSDYLSVLYNGMRPGGLSISDSHIITYPNSLFPEDAAATVKILTKCDLQSMLFNLNKSYASVWGKLFDKRIIDKYNLLFQLDITIIEDLLFLLTYMSYITNDILFSKKRTYFYYQHQQSASHTIVKKYDSIPDFFPECEALQRALCFLEPSQEVRNSALLVLMASERSALHIILLNQWKRHPLYYKYLKHIRSNLKLFLTYDAGQPLKAKAGMLLCCINPKIEFYLREVFKKFSSPSKHYIGSKRPHTTVDKVNLE